MKKLTYLFILLSITNLSFAQFDKPVFQLGIGLAEPFENLKGSRFTIDTMYQNIPVTLVDSNLFKTTYGAKTGFTIFGSAKINFDKYNIIRGKAFLSYTNFNTFQSSVSGNQVDAFISNGNLVYFAVPINYSYSFNAFSFGFGLEIAPTSFTNVFSPYFGANMSFNVFSATLDRTKNNSDTVGFSSSGFRIGVNFDAGIEAKFSQNFGMALGIKYDLGNLLLSSSSNGNLAEVYEWGSRSASLNDGEGRYISKLSNFLSDGYGREYNGTAKKIYWGTIYLALNFYPNLNTTTPKKK
ncbi:MAG TPA: hypothetical protein VIL99_14990 [Ignavibacteria bacterium]